MTKSRPIIPIQKMETIVPWGRRCECGTAMQVYPSEVRSALVDQKTWRQIVVESDYDYTRAGRTLDRFDCDWFGFHILGYRCLVCGGRSSDWSVQFTEAEATEIAASQNAAQGSSITETTPSAI